MNYIELDEYKQLLDRACDFESKAERLQKENNELRECLKEALSGIDEFMTRTIYFEHGKDIERWRAALEGGNHAND